METVWLTCLIAVGLLTVLGVVIYLTRAQGSKADHHLQRLQELEAASSEKNEYSEAHAEDFKAWNKKLRTTIIVAAGIVTLLAAIYVVASFLLI